MIIKCSKCGEQRSFTVKDKPVDTVLCPVCETPTMAAYQPVQTQKRYNKYGLTPEQRQQLYPIDGRCVICGLKSDLVLDHNHRTGKARGFVCQSCNLKIAGLDKDTFRIKAMAYLANPPAERFYNELQP